MIIITILYMGTNIGYITVLGPDGVRNSEVIAMVRPDKVPAGEWLKKQLTSS